MTTTTVGNRCIICKKQTAILTCQGCLKGFCYTDYGNHRQELNKQLDDIENNRDLLQQTLNEHITQIDQHSLVKQINQWEYESIEKIKQIAQETKLSLVNYMHRHANDIKVKLTHVTKQLTETRQENDFMEQNLDEWNKQLRELKQELNKPHNIKISYRFTPFINRIYFDGSSSHYIPDIPTDARWIQNGVTVAGGNGLGNGLNQLCNPCGMYIDDEDDRSIYVADYGEYRVMKWKKDETSGQIVAGGNGPGQSNNQLNCPVNVILNKANDSLIICDYNNQRVMQWPHQNGTSGETIISNIACWGLAIDNNGYLYVSNVKKHEVRRWKMGDMNGILVAGGNGAGNHLNQLDHPYFIFVDQDQSVYVSDGNNHRVMKWLKDAKEGIGVAGGQGQGNSLSQLSNPRGIVVDQLGTIYIADYGNHRVMRWFKGAKEGSVIIDGNIQGGQTHQFNGPCNLSFDKYNNLYVVDYFKHRIQKFNFDWFG